MASFSVNKHLFVRHFTLHKALYHAVMLWVEHLIKNPFFEQLDGVLIYIKPLFSDTPFLRLKHANYAGLQGHLLMESMESAPLLLEARDHHDPPLTIEI